MTRPHARAGCTGKANRHHGFTLVELMVVIAIIAVIAGFILYAVEGSLNTARMTQARLTAGEIAQAVELYRTDYGAHPLSPAGNQADQDKLIHTYLCGGGDGSLWDGDARRSRAAPLDYGDKRFVEVGGDHYLKSPWWESGDGNDDGAIIHARMWDLDGTNAESQDRDGDGDNDPDPDSDIPDGAPYGLAVYAWCINPDAPPDEEIVGNWKE
jgi:general secretion pathway protein G